MFFFLMVAYTDSKRREKHQLDGRAVGLDEWTSDSLSTTLYDWMGRIGLLHCLFNMFNLGLDLGYIQDKARVVFYNVTKTSTYYYLPVRRV